MAKELPYFKFEPAIYDTGSIQICSFEAQGVFINVCSMYWQRLGDLPYKLALQKICKGNATALDSLIQEDILKVKDGMICIDFLNEQLGEFENLSHTNSENARLGWEKRRLDATAKRPQSKPNAIRGEESKEDEIKGNESKEDKSINDAPKVATIEDRSNEFMNKVAAYIPTYGKEMLRDFFDYWTEMNEGGKKMRFEMQKVFDISRRLKTWSNNNKFKSNGSAINGNKKQQSDAATKASVEQYYRDKLKERGVQFPGG